VIRMAKELYSTHVAITGGRDGSAKSDDGKLAVALALPVAIGGSGNGTNPEQLFAAGFGACFTSSLAFAAKGMGVAAGQISVAVTVTLTLDDTGAFGIQARLVADLPNLTDADREWVIAEARRICAYSNALKGTAQVEVTRA
jgi:lipoyl-dependent peroxiredoxin